MKKLTILVDMDDTIENLSESWIKFINNRYGTSVKPEDVTEWSIEKAFPELSADCVYAVLNEKALWESVKPLPGAVKYLKRLIDDGNQVIIVTASHPNTIMMKMNLVLSRYFPFISYQNVVIASKKQLVRGDFLIDDNPNNMGGEYKGLLLTANHNLSVSDERLVEMNAVRVGNWEEVYELIHGYQKNCNKSTDGGK